MELLKTCSNNGGIQHDLQSSSDFNASPHYTFSDDIDSGASTPYVSAPSSPGRGPPHSYGGGFFYSAPASPTHHAYSNTDSVSFVPLEGSGGSFEFEFTVRQETTGAAPSGSMSSADELFLNGQIRPMKLSSHLQRPQDLAPLIDVLENNGENGGDEEVKFGRDRYRSKKPLRRRARSMSPLRTNSAFQWLEEFEDGRESTEIKEELELELELEAEEKQRADEDNEIPSSGASSRSSSVGRSSKRWVFLKELLYRSKSEGRNRNHKLWSALSFTPSSSGKKDKKSPKAEDGNSNSTAPAEGPSPKTTTKKVVNGVGVNRKRSMGRSAHEVHYTINRAQAEEMRKKTYLPYRQGLLGCIGFSSKSYGAMNGFAAAFNRVPSR